MNFQKKKKIDGSKMQTVVLLAYWLVGRNSTWELDVAHLAYCLV